MTPGALRPLDQRSLAGFLNVIERNPKAGLNALG